MEKRPTFRLVVAAAILASCGADTEPIAETTPAEEVEATLGPRLGDGSFPSLEPFVESRLWPLIRLITETEEGDPYPPETLETIAEFVGVQRGIHADALDVVEEMFGPSRSTHADAVFPPKPAWHQVVPVAMFLLQPLSESEEWNDDQLALAEAVAAFLNQQDGPPELAFVDGQDGANREQLASLSTWFRSEVEDPAAYAGMILSMDDGPWRPVPLASGERLGARSSMGVGDDLELRLHVDEERDPPWVLQCVRDGELAWTKRITEVPGGARLTFEGAMDPVELGPYGWKAYMRFGHPGDIEAAILYLDPQGELLFYFTSW